MTEENAVLLAGYLALFTLVGLAFVGVNLTIGWFVRPDNPTPEKGEIYECGEPTIGSSFVQFDLRFYVVALLFIIFDVEVAFFFPWAVVFGKSTHLREPNLPAASQVAVLEELGVAADEAALTADPAARERLRGSARWLTWSAVADIAVFFAVLLVGFAYVWARGDLDWVRAIGRSETQRTPTPPAVAEQPASITV